MSDDFAKNELKGRKFDYIWITQTMYHLTPENIDSCLHQMSEYMGTGSKLLCDITNNTMEFPDNSIWSGFPFYFHSL